MSDKEFIPAPAKAYYKYEVMDLYDIGKDAFSRWIKPFIPELEKLGYKTRSKKLTVAQVELIFNKLGTPYIKK